MADIHERDPWLLDLAAYFGPAAEYGMWLERDVLHIPAKIRYFTEDNPTELGIEITFLLFQAFLIFIVYPILEFQEGMPVSLRRIIRIGSAYLGILWVFAALVSCIPDSRLGGLRCGLC